MVYLAMNFYELNDYIKLAPESLHMITSAILLAMLAHLIIAYKATYKLLRTRVSVYWMVAYVIVFTTFFAKFSAVNYKMLDIFTPIYIIYYIHSILILKTRMFRCDINFKNFFKFNSVKS